MNTTAAVALSLLLITSFVPGRLAQRSDQSTVAGADFGEMLSRVEAAQVELVRGRAEAFKALWSHGDDVTLIGGLGGPIEKGWPLVSKRLDWVSSQYSEGTRRHQEVSRVVGGGFAHVVQRETLTFRAPADGREITQELRTTMVFRLESGHWRIVHRHADSLTVRQPAR
jgi:ketosteroid isomerase-like protein